MTPNPSRVDSAAKIQQQSSEVFGALVDGFMHCQPSADTGLVKAGAVFEQSRHHTIGALFYSLNMILKRTLDSTHINMNILDGVKQVTKLNIKRDVSYSLLQENIVFPIPLLFLTSTFLPWSISMQDNAAFSLRP